MMKGICIENMYQKRNLEDQDLLDTTASSKKMRGFRVRFYASRPQKRSGPEREIRDMLQVRGSIGPTIRVFGFDTSSTSDFEGRGGNTNLFHRYINADFENNL